MRGNQRIALITAAVAVLIVGFVVASPGGGGKAKPTVRQFQVLVAHGAHGQGVSRRPTA